MTESEIQCLKENIDKTVEIETTEGEVLIAKVLLVSQDDENGEHELLYEVVSSSTPEFYQSSDGAASFALDFEDILSVKSHP